MIDFWSLSDEDIRRCTAISDMDFLPDESSQDQLVLAFWYEYKLRRFGRMLRSCGWDRTLMKIVHHDEIEALSNSKIKRYNWNSEL